jgi:FKBP-type peptidyl-prolyl cis-trans isomerase SlyD
LNKHIATLGSANVMMLTSANAMMLGMGIQQNDVVSFEYRLTVSESVVDASDGEPLLYLHGHGNIIAGLEQELAGMKLGEEKTVVVSPQDGYGLYDEELIQTIPTTSFDDELEVGGHYTGENEDGEPVSFVVLEIEGQDALVDFNHPLAGDTLEFWVKVVGIREATPQELEHGHAHHNAVIQA